VIDTPEFTSACATCGKYFKNGETWDVTLHRDDDYDLHFCSYDCLDEYVVEREVTESTIDETIEQEKDVLDRLGDN